MFKFKKDVISFLGLSSFLLAFATGQQPMLRSNLNPDHVVRFSFRFGGFGTDTPLPKELERDDVEGVMCQMEDFLSQVAQNATGNDNIAVETREITWATDASLGSSHVNFTISLEDGSPTDVSKDATLMDQLKNTDLGHFLTEWVWNAEPEDSFFRNATSVGWEAATTSPVKGFIEEVDCVVENMASPAVENMASPTVDTQTATTTEVSSNATFAPAVEPGDMNSSMPPPQAITGEIRSGARSFFVTIALPTSFVAVFAALWV